MGVKSLQNRQTPQNVRSCLYLGAWGLGHLPRIVFATAARDTWGAIKKTGLHMKLVKTFLALLISTHAFAGHHEE